MWATIMKLIMTYSFGDPTPKHAIITQVKQKNSFDFYF